MNLLYTFVEAARLGGAEIWLDDVHVITVNADESIKYHDFYPNFVPSSGMFVIKPLQITLSPCPFCGDTATLRINSAAHFVKCTNFACQCEQVAFSNSTLAAAAWNTRV